MSLTTAKVIGENGNVFSILAICKKALMKAGFLEEANEMTMRVFTADSYVKALAIMQEYCEFE